VQAQQSKAQVVGIAGGPPNNTNEIKLAQEFGLLKGGQQLAVFLILITDVHALGLNTAQGLILTTSFYWDMDEKTRVWSKRFYEKMQRMPTMWQAGVYSSVTHYLNVVKAAGTDDPEKVTAKMRSTPVEDFFSRNGHLRKDGLMVHDLLLVQVKSPAESKAPWDYFNVLGHINGKDAFGPPDPDCALVRK
jgi:branched-chain amino acid transport system substrate-binding protein